MPLLEKIQRKARRSWGKASKSSKPSSKTSTRNVRFHLWPEIIACDYTITDSIKQDVWYQTGELMAIKNTIEKHLRKVVAGERSACADNCHRGLESLLRDITGAKAVRKEKHSTFSRALLQLQKRQCAQGRIDEEQLRRFSCRTSNQSQELAELLAARDALCALRIYQDANHWQIPLLKKYNAKMPQRQQEPVRKVGIPRPADPALLRTNSSRAA